MLPWQLTYETMKEVSVYTNKGKFMLTKHSMLYTDLYMMIWFHAPYIYFVFVDIKTYSSEHMCHVWEKCVPDGTFIN